MNIATQYPTPPLHDPNQAYKKGDLVYNRATNFVCVQDHGNASGTQNIDPYNSCIENGDDSYWSVWAPGRCFGDTAYFYFKKAPYGWIYFKDYINGKQDIATITDLYLKDRIMQVLELPAAIQGKWRDETQGLHFDLLLATGTDMGTMAENRVGVLEEDTMQLHGHTVTRLWDRYRYSRIALVARGTDEKSIGFGTADEGFSDVFQINKESVLAGADFDDDKNYARTGVETKPKNLRGFKAIYVGGTPF